MYKFSHLKFILALVFVLVIVSIGYAGWKNLNSSNKLKDQSNTSVDVQNTHLEPIDTNNQKISEIDTSDWKSYQNERYQFKLKYPPTWGVKEQDGVITFKPSLTDYGCDILINENPQKFSLEAWLHANYNPKLPEAITILSEKAVTINGSKALEIESTGPGAFKLRQLLFSKKGNIIIIGYITNISSILKAQFEEYSSGCENMFKSFRFL